MTQKVSKRPQSGVPRNRQVAPSVTYLRDTSHGQLLTSEGAFTHKGSTSGAQSVPTNFFVQFIPEMRRSSPVRSTAYPKVVNKSLPKTRFIKVSKNEQLPYDVAMAHIYDPVGNPIIYKKKRRKIVKRRKKQIASPEKVLEVQVNNTVGDLEVKEPKSKGLKSNASIKSLEKK